MLIFKKRFIVVWGSDWIIAARSYETDVKLFRFDVGGTAWAAVEILAGVGPILAEFLTFYEFKNLRKMDEIDWLA